MLSIGLNEAICKYQITDATFKAEDGVLNFGNSRFDRSILRLSWLVNDVVNQSEQKLESI